MKAEKAKNAAKGLQEDSVDAPNPPQKTQKPKIVQKPIPKKKATENLKKEFDRMDHGQKLENEDLQKQIEFLKTQMSQTQPRTQQQQQKPKSNGLPPWAKKEQYQQPQQYQEPMQPQKKALLIPPNYQQTSKPNGHSPQASSTIDILQRLQGDKSFITTSQKYGQAIAASILAKASSIPGNRVNFEDEARKTVQFQSGSYALIYKNGTPVRLAPYTWSLDQQTRRMWAVFNFNDFYGNKNPSPIKIWKSVSTAIVLSPLSHTSNMADNYGKGYLTKFDEGTQFQQALTLKDDQSIEQIRSENKHFLSSALTLWMDLQSYTKPKLNLKIILIIVALIAVVAVAYFLLKSNPNLLKGILPS